MRTGSYEAKVSNELSLTHRHRVIVPVYVPHLNDYFANIEEILKLCLESLRLTTAGRAKITVVSNGCCEPIVELLQEQSREGWIDQLVLNAANLGKIDAVSSLARGAFEEFITFTDCDVLFHPGWLEALEELLAHFPECGFVSPFPNPALTWYHNSATILGGLMRGELKWEAIVPAQDLDRFARSIGNPEFFREDQRTSQLILERDGYKACLGCGHFVCTLRKAVVAAMPEGPSLKAIHGRSEERWLDMPADRLGYWRLATPRAYAEHMGNVPEDWMYQEIEACRAAAAAMNGNGSEHTPLPIRKPWPQIASPRWRWRAIGALKKARVLKG